MKARSVIQRAIPLLLGAGVLFAAACDDADSVVGSTPVVVQGDGNVVEESRAVGGIRNIDMNGVGILYIRQAAQEELNIRAEENLLQYLRTDVQAGELVIWKEGATLMNTRPIEYHLTVVDLERLALTGAGGIEATNLDIGPLELLRTGVGTIEFVDLIASSLDVESSGLGEVILSGSVHRQTIELRSMGDYDGRYLDSVEADVLIANAGSATVRVSDHLSATIRGSGSVYYLGDPVVDSDIGGSGEVVRIGG